MDRSTIWQPSVSLDNRQEIDGGIKIQREISEITIPEEQIEELSVGIDFLTDFWREKYLKEYIREGGSKIKFVTGQPGSGKSHLLKLTSRLAKQENYVTVSFSAKEIWMHDFRKFI